MSRNRVSRALIALLGVTFVLGAVAYFHNPNRSKAGDAKKESAAQPAGPAGVQPGAAPVAGHTAPANPFGAATRPTQIALGPSIGSAIVTRTPAVEPAAGTPGVPGAGGTATPAPGGGGATPAPAAPAGAAKPPVTLAGGAPAAPATPATAAPPGHSARTPAAAPAPAPAAPVKSTGNALVDGKALIDAGSLLAGRRLLNDALVSNALSAADQAAAKEMMAKVNETVIFSPRRVADDPFVGTYTVQAGDKPMKIAAASEVTWDFLGRINNIPDARRLRAGATLKTVKGPFHAVVSKSKFTLDLYLGSPGERGSVYVRTFRIGHGKNNSTPTGTWMVSPQGKLKNPKWWGTADEPAREADDPQNPLGEFWIGLTGTDGEALGKQGFGIHGTIEPDTIGKEASHGCVRLLNSDVELVYSMLVEGKSTVIIKE